MKSLGKAGFSLGTNFWSGGVTDGNSQQTGIVKFRSGDFRFQYENDGTPFQKIGAGDGGDSYRTAAASIGIGEFSAGFNLFTGHRPTSSYAERGGEDLQEMQRAQSLGKNSRGNYNVWMPNGFVQEDKPQYRMGALYFSYKNYRVGIDSDRYVRHPIQDIFAHHLVWFARQPGFQTLSNSVLPYGQYQTSNSFTSW